MNIKEFFLKSVGEWNSMRSGHSLAFQEFEEIRSKIKISPSKPNDARVIKFLKDNLITTKAVNKAFLISWEAKVNGMRRIETETLLVKVYSFR